MNNALIILIFEIVSMNLLVLGVHSIRHKTGLGPYYALLGGITAIMAWTTDAGVRVQAGGITFLVGSTVFYTSLLLGVFVLYVFDGPKSTRVAIATVAGISALTPIVASVLHVQMGFTVQGVLASVPTPSLRINTASVLTTIVDLVFLAIAWEFLGKINPEKNTWLRAYLTLLGVMVLDVVLFNTGAFLGTGSYLEIMQGTLVTRLLLSVVAFPFLYIYLRWQGRQEGVSIKNRPVLSIFGKLEETQNKLEIAREEIKRRKEAEERESFLHSLLRHDVRNKSQIVQGYLELSKDYDLPEEVEDWLSKAEEATKNGIKIIEKVRTLRELTEEEEKSEVDICSLIQEVIDKRGHVSESINIELECQKEGIKVKGGPILEELFSNLIENAVDHADCDKIRIYVKEGEDKNTVLFEDNGKGISDEDKEKIFEKGFKDKETGGSGLGLYLVKEIAKNYGGTVEVKDSKLGGARFDIYFQKA